MKIPRSNNSPCLSIHFVYVVLCGSQVDILDAIVPSQDKRLREYLFRPNPVEITREMSLEDLAKIRAANYGWI